MQCVLEAYFPRKLLISALVFLLSTSLDAKVNPYLQIDLQTRVLKSFSLKDACLKNYRESPLLSNIEGTKLNCMGKVFSPRSLCKGDKVVNSVFTRALISNDQLSIICEFATFVNVNLNCEHSLIRKECRQSAERACQTLGRNYAHDLKLIHSAKIKRDDTTLADCHFSNQLF